MAPLAKTEKIFVCECQTLLDVIVCCDIYQNFVGHRQGQIEHWDNGDVESNKNKERSF